jgi:hypothetical protein
VRFAGLIRSVGAATSLARFCRRPMKRSSTQCSSDQSCMILDVSSVPLSIRRYFG